MTRVRSGLHVVVSVHDPPMWTLPDREVTRIIEALPDDVVVSAREPEEKQEALAQADVLVTTRLTAEESALASRLKWIHTTAVGLGGLLSPQLAGRDVVITNSRGVHSESIAEHAIALALALRRALPAAVARQAARDWAQVELSTRTARPLSSTRMLVVGLGAIGAKVAAMAAGLGMTVTGVRRRIDLPVPPGVDEVLPASGLVEGLRTADVVVLAAPSTYETKALVGAAELDVMRPTAVIANIARGRLIDHEALVAALRAGRLAGAGLDALPREPLPPDDPLWAAPNLLISPHIAAFAGDYWAPAVDLFLENMARYKRDEPLLNVVDKHRGY